MPAYEPAPLSPDRGWLIRLQPHCLDFFDLALNEGPATLMAEALSHHGSTPAAGEQILVIRGGTTFVLDVLAVSQAAGIQGVQFDFRAPTSSIRLPPRPPLVKLSTAGPCTSSEALSASLPEATARPKQCPGARVDNPKTASYGTAPRGRLFPFQGEGRTVAPADTSIKSGDRIGIEHASSDQADYQSCIPPDAHAEGRRLGHGPLRPHPQENQANRGEDAGEGGGVACQDCGVLVPALNRQLHSLRCHGADLRTRAPRGGQALSPPRPPNRAATVAKSPSLHTVARMVQLRPDGWGQPIIGPPIDIPATVRNGKEEERPLPRVHVRIKLAEGEEGSGGDVFEDWIDWDVRDPFLKDPETFAVSLGNQFGLSIGTVEGLARSVTDQLRRLAASSATVPGAAQEMSHLVLPPPVPASEGVGRLHLLLTPEELQAQAAARLAGEMGAHKREVPDGQWGYEDTHGAYPSDTAPATRGQAKGRRRSAPLPKLEMTADGPNEKTLAIRRLTGTGKEAEALQDYYIEQQLPAIEEVLKAMRIESTRVLRSTPTELLIVPNASCHGCKVPVDAALQICPRAVGSHSLCGMHFLRSHGLNEAEARARILADKTGNLDNLPEHLKEHPVPVCLVCSMACPCKVCARFNMRKALDLWQRYLNERAGRDADFDGPNQPVMALLHDETEPIPHHYIVQCVARMMTEEDRHHTRRSSDGPSRRKQTDTPPATGKPQAPPPTRKKGGKAKKRAVTVHIDFCICCSTDRKEPLLECAQCPRAYHPSCVRRKMDVKPPSVTAEVKMSKARQWKCEVCREEEDEASKLLVPTAAEEGRKDLERDCRRLLHIFWNHELVGAFKLPVDDSVAPDYSKFVATPICLREIRGSHFVSRTRKGNAYDPIPFLMDVKRVWHNCRLYNAEGSLIRCIGDLLEKVFDRNVSERFLPQMTPEAQVELKEKMEALNKEFTDAMASLKAEGLVPASPPASPGKAAVKEEEGVEEEEEEEEALAPAAEQRPAGKYIYKDDYEEEPPEEEEADEYASEDEEYRPGKKKRRDSGGSASGGARAQSKRGRGGRGGGGERETWTSAGPSHGMSPHGIPPPSVPPDLMLRFQYQPVPLMTQLHKVTPDLKLLAGHVIQHGPNDTYCVQYENGFMEWLDKARVLAYLAAETAKKGSAPQMAWRGRRGGSR